MSTARAIQFRRQELPYGAWTCEGGREVLFNRSYKPLWSRTGGVTDPACRDEWVSGICATRWFYADGRPEAEKVKNARAALLAWGLPA